MRVFKEITSLVLLFLLGIGAGWWCIKVFGVAATCELLKWGGFVTSGFFVVMRRLNAAFEQGASLNEFDAVTRERYDLALATYRRRFRSRILIGLALAAVAATAGTLVGKSTSVAGDVAFWLTLGAAGMLTSSAALVAVQLWVSSWPSEYLAAIRRAAAEQVTRKAGLRTYQDTPEEAL